jgi:hypothetical protein
MAAPDPNAAPDRFPSFEAFYPFYLSEHGDRTSLAPMCASAHPPGRTGCRIA